MKEKNSSNNISIKNNEHLRVIFLFYKGISRMNVLIGFSISNFIYGWYLWNMCHSFHFLATTVFFGFFILYFIYFGYTTKKYLITILMLIHKLKKKQKYSDENSFISHLKGEERFCKPDFSNIFLLLLLFFQFQIVLILSLTVSGYDDEILVLLIFTVTIEIILLIWMLSFRITINNEKLIYYSLFKGREEVAIDRISGLNLIMEKNRIRFLVVSDSISGKKALNLKIKFFKRKDVLELVDIIADKGVKNSVILK